MSSVISYLKKITGDMPYLMSQSPNHKNFFISDLEWMVITPILLKQFRVFYAKDRPIGCMMWAYANEDVAERLSAGNARLKPQDWKSGEDLWVVDIIAPYGGQDEMLKDLKEKVFMAEKVKFLSVVEGKMVVKEV